MKSNGYFYLLTIVFITACLASCSKGRTLTNDEISYFERNVEIDTILQQRLMDSDLLSVAYDSAAVASLDTSCAIFLRNRGITDQKKSGRCWYFSTTNILRREMIMEYDLEGFEFSQTYGQFWDLMEKSNRFLDNVISMRKRSLHNRFNTWLFSKPFGDGGHFMNAAHLIDKYGVVPKEAMPEVRGSMDNARLMRTLRTLMRKRGLELRSCRRRDIDSIRISALADVYRLLRLTLGNPPKEFTWTLCDRNGRVIDTKTYTPLSFRDRFVVHDMEKDFAILMNDPTLPYHRMYSVRESRNCYEYPDWTFLNLPMDEIDKIGLASLKGGDMFYISADTYQDSLQQRGIYSTETFRTDSILGIDLNMSKLELLKSDEISSAHAIAVAGVDTLSDGRPFKWVIENSFGLSRGFGGYVIMTREWFDRYVLRMAVLRKYLPAYIEKETHSRPHPIPAWNPTY